MSTNFYWKTLPKALEKYDTQEKHDMLMHIGKRSAGGRYCYSCGTTLNDLGTKYIHTNDGRWYNKCPICGKEVDTYVCTFTWTFMLQKEIIDRIIMFGEDYPCIIDEYDREYTAREFMKEIDSPVYYQMASNFC